MNTSLALLLGAIAGIIIHHLISHTILGARLEQIETRVANEADELLTKVRNEIASLKSHTTAEAAAVKTELAGVEAGMKKDVADVKGTLGTVASTVQQTAIHAESAAKAAEIVVKNDVADTKASAEAATKSVGAQV